MSPELITIPCGNYDSVTSAASPTARIGTSSSFEMLLQNGPTAPAPYKWGWTDNGWDTLGTHVYFASSGIHTIRVQQREDGATIDQIVISPDTYLTMPPGWTHNDQTIYGASQSPSINLPPSVTLAAPANGASYTAPATITLSATASRSRRPTGEGRFLQWSHAARQRHDRAVQFLVAFCAGWNISAESGGTRRGRRLGLVPDSDGDGRIRNRDIVDKPSRFHRVGGSRDRLALLA